MATIKVLKNLEIIGRDLIEKNGIKNYKLSIIFDRNSSNVSTQIDRSDFRNNSYVFEIGHSSYYGDFDEVLDIVHKKYPITKNINSFIVILLHEVGHILDTVNPKSPRNFYTTEEYRELPREKAADMFAENFIWNNPKLCEEFSKMADEAIEEFWNN